jgi:serine/threonine protein kinase
MADRDQGMLAKEPPAEDEATKFENIKSITVPKYRVRGNVVEYVVSCQNEKTMWQVFRRYQAFKKLHSDLAALCTFTNPNHCQHGVVPVLCGSHLFEATNQSQELVERRRRYLEVYLQQLLVPSNSFYPEVDALKSFLLDDMMPIYFRSKTTKLVPGLSMAMDSECASTLEDVERQGFHGPAENNWQCVAFTPNTEAPDTAVHPSIPDLSSAGGNKTHGGAAAANGGDGAAEASPERTMESSASLEHGTRNGMGKVNGNGDTSATLPGNCQLREQCMRCDYVSVVDYPREEWQDFGLCGNCGHFARHRLMEGEPDGRQTHEPGQRPADAPDMGTSPGADGEPRRRSSSDENASPPAEPVVEVAPRDLGNASIADFSLVTTLGRGTFGKVMKVLHRPTGRIMAMKVLTKSVVAQRRMVEYIREERDIMAMLPPHPFVVTMHYALQTDHHLYFLLDYLPGGELYSHIHPKAHVPEAVARFYICEVILAIEHVHRYDVCHRDLKPENVVIAADGHIALTDFGLARAKFSKARRKSFVGSAEYLAPETVRNEVQTKALDWWSVGVMLYEMLVGRTPFHGATNTEVYNNVVHKPLDLTNKRNVTPDAADLLRRFLDRTPSSRLQRPDEIKKHPFFRDVDWNAFLRKDVKPPFVPDLGCNDTKYFAREFTSEWACVQKASATDSQTMRQWREKFDNFAVSKESVMRVTGPADAAAASSAVDRPLAETYVEPYRFIGAWRLMRLELKSSKGQVTYPWGAEVAGMLMYTTAGYFSMQLAPIKRSKFKRHSTDDMAQAFVGYVAQFGSYHLRAGWNFLVHAPTCALNPNMSSTLQRRFFQFDSKFTTLTLTTDEFCVEDQERLVVRTVTTWERVPPRPGFTPADAEVATPPTSPAKPQHLQPAGVSA